MFLEDAKLNWQQNIKTNLEEVIRDHKVLKDNFFLGKKKKNLNTVISAWKALVYSSFLHAEIILYYWLFFTPFHFFS